MPLFDVTKTPGIDPVVGAYLSTLDFGRPNLIKAIKNLTPEQLEQKPAKFKNSIATLVVHIAATEVSFAHRIMGQKMSDELKAEFPPHTEELLPEIKGLTADDLVAKLEKSRAILMEVLKGLTAEDLRREIVANPERSMTVEFYVALLPIHFMSHAGHIQMLIQHL